MEKRIIEGALRIVARQGVRFTMDELATELGMSKKTIYTVFSDKNELLLAMVDYVFDYIKESEAMVMEDKHLSLLQKIRKILGVLLLMVLIPMSVLLPEKTGFAFLYSIYLGYLLFTFQSLIENYRKLKGNVTIFQPIIKAFERLSGDKNDKNEGE